MTAISESMLRVILFALFAVMQTNAYPLLFERHKYDFIPLDIDEPVWEDEPPYYEEPDSIRDLEPFQNELEIGTISNMDDEDLPSEESWLVKNPGESERPSELDYLVSELAQLSEEKRSEPKKGHGLKRSESFYVYPSEERMAQQLTKRDLEWLRDLNNIPLSIQKSHTRDDRKKLHVLTTTATSSTVPPTSKSTTAFLSEEKRGQAEVPIFLSNHGDSSRFGSTHK